MKKTNETTATNFGYFHDELAFLETTFKFKLITPIERTEIKKLKDAGGERPTDISLGDWQGPEKVTDRHKKMCVFLVADFSNGEIAKEFNISDGRLSIVLSASNIRLYCAKLRKELENIDIRGCVLAGEWDLICRNLEIDRDS